VWSFDRKKGPFLCVLRECWHTLAHMHVRRRANICQSIFHARAQRFRFVCCPIPPLSRRRSFHHVNPTSNGRGVKWPRRLTPTVTIFSPRTTVNTNAATQPSKKVPTKKLLFPRAGIILVRRVVARCSAYKSLKAIKQHNILLLYSWFTRTHIF